jgi:glucose dehydrogenase
MTVSRAKSVTAFLVALTSISIPALHGQTDWPVYGHDPGGMRYSPLKQITPTNVTKLVRAWTYDTSEGSKRPRAEEVTPLVVNDVMYVPSSYGRVVALEPETGKVIWRYEVKRSGPASERGLAYWPGDKNSPPELLFGTSDGKLTALNAKTGELVPEFGEDGLVNMRIGVADDYPDHGYGVTSAPVIYKDLVISGSRVQETPSQGPYGDVRAWDVHSGKLVWTFHTVARPGEPGHETWEGNSWKDRSGVNVWGGMTVDVERGMVFLPIGEPSADFYGGDRKGADLYSSSLVALDASTGKIKWYFQTTHHDIFDYDLNAPPALVEIDHGGKKIPAVAETTKQGLMFLFDRVTGKPIYGVEERPVPKSDQPGEANWPTEPFPVKPPPVARNSFSPAEVARVTPEHQKFCEGLLAADGGARTGGPYQPYGTELTVNFPGMFGGSDWGGVSFDPQLGYVFVNTQDLGTIFRVVVKGEGANVQVTRVSPTGAVGGLGGGGGYGGNEGVQFWNPDTLWACVQPPWGRLVAVNVNTGEIAWQVPLGEFDALTAKGVPKTGASNMGGSIATAGGLVFIGATNDSRFRAFDSRTGKELWVTKIDASAHAVPITFLGKDGKQYVVIMAAGGGAVGDTTHASSLTAFALP